ncbi:MAG: GTP-binding protein [Methanosarcinales archaeon]|nr:GTP-binding protein [Methanosarcinales archaeon]
MVNSMLETGIPRLDEYLSGGIPEGKTLIYLNHPGVEGDVFGMQTLYHCLTTGNNCIYIASSLHPKMLIDQFSEFGWAMDKYKDRLNVIDAYSSLVGDISSEKYIVPDPEDINSITEVIDQVIKDVPKGSVFVFSSLSTIMDLCGEENTINAVRSWNKSAKTNKIVNVYNFTAWPYTESTLAQIKTDLFNCVINVGGIAQQVIYGQYFGVAKADWLKLQEKSMLFRVLRPGGIKIYLPKILVTGPFNAGKSTFVHSLSTRAVSVDRKGTTIALDHGHIDYKGFSADIFGTPGQDRFDPIIKMISGEAMGVFLVVDSTNPENFNRAQQMLEITTGYGLPYVIIANKQDMPDAISIDDIRTRLNLPEEIPVVSTVATEKRGVFEAFEMLVERITGGI